MNATKLAAALRAAADAIDEGVGDTVAATLQAAQTVPAPRGRGRPPKAVEAAPVASVAAPTAVEADPFEATPAAPAATLEEVRAALTALRAATSQDFAMTALKPFAPNLTDLKPEQYGAVVVAAKAAMPAPAPVAEPEDPFATPAATLGAALAPPAAKAATLEDVQKAVVNAQKRTSTDKAQAVVMKHGGVGNKPDGSGKGPSLKALAATAYAAVIAELDALPTTKTG